MIGRLGLGNWLSLAHGFRQSLPEWRSGVLECTGKAVPRTGLGWAHQPLASSEDRWGRIPHAPRRRRFGLGRLETKAASGSCRRVIRY